MPALGTKLELKVPPVPLAVGFAAVMGVAAWLVPSLHVRLPLRSALAATLVLLGAGIAVAGVISFRRERTTVNPLRPERATTLVASGIYRLTRNPMYLGLLLVLAGWAWFLGSALGLLLLPFFVLYMNRFQIEPEEHALLARFGDDFRAYQRATRRWL